MTPSVTEPPTPQRFLLPASSLSAGSSRGAPEAVVTSLAAPSAPIFATRACLARCDCISEPTDGGFTVVAHDCGDPASVANRIAQLADLAKAHD